MGASLRDAPLRPVETFARPTPHEGCRTRFDPTPHASGARGADAWSPVRRCGGGTTAAAQHGGNGADGRPGL